MKDLTLLFLIIFVLLSIVVVWYLSNRVKYVPKHAILDVSDDGCLLEDWIDAEVPRREGTRDRQEIASLALEKLYGVRKDKRYLAVAKNLPPREEGFYDLRSKIGVNAQIQVCRSKSEAKRLCDYNDYSRIDDILQQVGAVEEITQFLEKTMSWRWRKLREVVPDLEETGSYLYLPVLLKKTLAAETRHGYRYNLMTREKEFVGLLARLQETATETFLGGAKNELEVE